MSNLWAQHWHEILFFVFGFFGMVAHYIKKQAMDGVEISISNWFGKDLPKTITAVMAFIGAATSALSAEVVTVTSGMWAVVYAGMITGYASDSFNGVKPVAKGKIE